jgi:type II secretory pathway component GspD/PulD (secretin)
VQQKVAKLIDDLRVSMGLGQQVSLEARFLLVTENFLEDIGFDVDFTSIKLGGQWDPLQVEQTNLVDTRNTAVTPPAMSVKGAYGGILDDLQVQFLIKATQQASNARALQAPRVTVLSGESATFRVTTENAYVSNITSEQSASGSTTNGDNTVFQTLQTEISTVTDGVILNVQPTISADKKYVILRIITTTANADITSARTQFTFTPVVGSPAVTITVPSVTRTDVQTRVNVPDKGTLLLGGQKITDETEQEAGVPILGKLPVVGRLFNNRNQQRSQKVLLVLVTPTILLQDENEAEAVASLRPMGM